MLTIALSFGVLFPTVSTTLETRYGSLGCKISLFRTIRFLGSQNILFFLSFFFHFFSFIISFLSPMSGRREALLIDTIVQFSTLFGNHQRLFSLSDGTFPGDQFRFCSRSSLFSVEKYMKRDFATTPIGAFR